MTLEDRVVLAPHVVIPVRLRRPPSLRPSTPKVASLDGLKSAQIEICLTLRPRDLARPVSHTCGSIGLSEIVCLATLGKHGTEFGACGEPRIERDTCGVVAFACILRPFGLRPVGKIRDPFEHCVLPRCGYEGEFNRSLQALDHGGIGWTASGREG